MRYFLIADNTDTLTGMRLAGVDGVVAHERDEVIETIGRTLGDGNIAILLITEKLAGLAPETIHEIRLNRNRPLIVVIPDRHGTGRSPDSITRYIREAIGIKI